MMIRSLFHATTIPGARPPHNTLHLKICYPAAPENSEAERMTGVISADKSAEPLPVVIFFNGINVGIESYHWLAVRLAEARIVTVLYTHIAETLPGIVGLTPGIDLARVRPDSYGSGPTCPAIQPVLDALAQLNSAATSPLSGALDLNRIILGGHSAGGTVALQNGRFFDQVTAVFAWAGHTMASTLLGFPPGTILPVGDKSFLLMRGDRDGVIAASRSRYETGAESPDPVALTFDHACQPAAGHKAYDGLIPGANHFSIAHPLDETTGRAFLDLPMTRPAAEIRDRIAGLILAFVHKQPLNPHHALIREKG
jgi:predicted dienelactone hydrolase